MNQFAQFDYNIRIVLWQHSPPIDTVTMQQIIVTALLHRGQHPDKVQVSITDYASE